MSRTTTPRLAATGLLSLTAAVAGLAFAPSASATAALPAAEVSATTVLPGADFTVSGTDCLSPDDADYEGVVFVMSENGEIQEVVEPAANGSWSLTTSFPADTATGDYAMVASCEWYTGGVGYPEWTMTLGGEVGAIRGVEANTPGTKNVTTDKTTGATSAPGQKVVKVIAGFQPHEKVTLVLHSTPTTLGTFEADAAGVLTVEFTLPAGTAVGTHTLVFDGTVTYYQENLEVTAAATAQLAYTGADMTVPLTLGVGLVLAGAGALVVSRRRGAGAPQA
ncbi:MAG: LPXTG-motif cell wall anchor domain protein [Blastococcus sp.]|jgi:LPXTG-motif cell wall-anchored protein|nr:LPXTG-motif cell wall anchor domain protein [Blastococcus sp.]